MKHTQLSDTYTVLLGGLHLLYETVLYFKIELWSLYLKWQLRVNFRELTYVYYTYSEHIQERNLQT